MSLAASAHLTASALAQPLIAGKISRTESWSSGDSSDDESDDPGGRTLGPRFFGKDLVRNVGSVLLAAGGLAASTAAMVTMPGAVVFLMGGICAINSPLVAVKQVHLAKHAGEHPRASSKCVRCGRRSLNLRDFVLFALRFSRPEGQH